MITTRPNPSFGALRSLAAPIRKYSLWSSPPALSFSDGTSSSARTPTARQRLAARHIRVMGILREQRQYIAELANRSCDSSEPEPEAGARATVLRKAPSPSLPLRAPAHPTPARPYNSPRMKPTPAVRRRAAKVLAALAELYPDAHCALEHRTPFQLLVATILSAQCTDARVNLVTPVLFAHFRTVRHFAEADPGELERMIASTGFFRNKTKNIIACCRALLERHNGAVPGTLEELVQLPG